MRLNTNKKSDADLPEKIVSILNEHSRTTDDWPSQLVFIETQESWNFAHIYILFDETIVINVIRLSNPQLHTGTAAYVPYKDRITASSAYMCY